MINQRVAIITGSSRGIGAATARLLAQEGYRICVNYRSNEAAANEIIDELVRNGATAIAVQADVSKEDITVRMFQTVDWELGPVTA